MTSLPSVAGENEWAVFRRVTREGAPIVIRSRANDPVVRNYALRSTLSRLRLQLASELVDASGMPISTEAIDLYEDELVDEFEKQGSKTILFAIATSGGSRDLFLASSDTGELIAVIKKIQRERSFTLQITHHKGPKEDLLNSLVP